MTLFRAPRSLAVLLLAAAALATAQPARAQVRIVDDRGQTVTLPAPARRIVSLTPSLSETVCAIGACDRLVGVDRYASWPASVLALPKVGSVDHPQVEGIVALKPDLVLLKPRSKVADQLESLGIPVLALDAKTHADVRRVMQTLAVAVGRPAAGDAPWQRIEKNLAAAAARVPPAWSGARVYFEVHGASAAGEASFIGETLARLGLKNIVPAASGPFARVNPEFVVRADPDLLMASAHSELIAMTGRPGWSRMKAIRGSQTCAFAPDRLDVMMRPGPRLDEAADEVVACLTRLSTRLP